MKLIILAAASFISCAFSQTPRPAEGVKGRLYVDVDDGARVFINGKMVLDASVSDEISIQPGDRIVAQLHDTGGGRFFKMAFLATDQKSLIAFKRSNFRVIDDVALADFTAADIAKWSKTAKAGSYDRERFHFKNNADSIWGDHPNTALGCLVTADMFKPYAAPQTNQLPILLTVEALVDGPSTLNVRTDGVSWTNGQNAKPGLLRLATYVDGKEWMPKWGVAGQERGFDRSDIFPIRLDHLDLTVETASNWKERGVDVFDPSRSPIAAKKRGPVLEVVVPDPEAGARWYKLVFRGRKK